MNRRKVAWFLVILAVFIFVGSPFKQEVQAVGATGSLIAIIIAALAALGITITAANGWSSVNEYVEELLNEYADSRGISYSSLFTGVQSGTNSLGQILLNNRFVILINGFAAWLKVKLGLVDNHVVNIMPTLTLSGLTLFQMNTYYVVTEPTSGVEFIFYYYYEPSANQRIDDVYVFFRQDESGNYYTELCARRSITGSFYEERYDEYFNFRSGSGGGRGVTNYNGNGVYYEISSASGVSFIPEGVVPFVGDYAAISAWIGRASFVESSDIQVITGDIVLPEDDSRFTEGDGAILDLDADWGLTYGQVVDEIPDNYEEAEIEYEGEAQITDQVEDTPSQSVSSDAAEYQVIGLQNVFPFCIPFDIYSFFECLAADPVAPVVNWRFYVPGICDETITLDLSQFNTVAQVLRTMELLAFIVGLALVTREKFLRG